MITVYGIPNCDNCRAARKWFDSQACDYQFHDLRAEGIDVGLLVRWQKALGDEALLNKRSQAWRAIPEKQRESLDSTSVRSLILAHPTLVKRPVVDNGVNVRLGYDEAEWKRLFF